MNSIEIPAYCSTDQEKLYVLAKTINSLQQQVKDLQKEIHHIKMVCGVDVVIPEYANKEEYIKEHEKMYGKIRNFKE